MDFKDYYKTLGVSRDADDKAIKAAYRKLARKLHPDVSKEAGAEERLKDVNEAYEVLKDPEKRAKYDRYGADWERYQEAATSGAGAAPGGARSGQDFSDWFYGGEGGPRTRYEYRTPGEGHFSDFFETLFGDTFGRTTQRRAPAPQRGQDYEQPVEISLSEAYHGVTRQYDVRLQEQCPTCGGTGLAGQRVCPTCGGTGYVSRTKVIEVKIPAGVRDGSRVRVAGQGGPGVNGGPSGDIYLIISLAPNPRFELDGDNIRTNVDVPLYTAMLGGEVLVQTLDKPVVLRIPPETQNGRVFRLRGKGMPSLRGTTRGDLLVRVKVQLPTHLTDEERQLFERLREARAARV